MNKTSLIVVLRDRFNKNMHRHNRLRWNLVEQQLNGNNHLLNTISEMENTGGEPDIIELFPNEYVFCDLSTESPSKRRSMCYDKKALDSRKNNKPTGNAIELADKMGIEILDETQYCKLQETEKIDLKTSSWIKTPDSIRNLGGALFGDRRYDHVFIYHNGADSYYAARGFRGFIKVEIEI